MLVFALGKGGLQEYAAKEYGGKKSYRSKLMHYLGSSYAIQCLS